MRKKNAQKTPAFEDREFEPVEGEDPGNWNPPEGKIDKIEHLKIYEKELNNSSKLIVCASTFLKFLTNHS